jgi:hypothetical protein
MDRGAGCGGDALALALADNEADADAEAVLVPWLLTLWEDSVTPVALATAGLWAPSARGPISNTPLDTNPARFILDAVFAVAFMLLSIAAVLLVAAPIAMVLSDGSTISVGSG